MFPVYWWKLRITVINDMHNIKRFVIQEPFRSFGSSDSLDKALQWANIDGCSWSSLEIIGPYPWNDQEKGSNGYLKDV